MNHLEYIIEPPYPDAPIRYFQDLTRIPRASGNEQAVSDWLLQFAADHNLEAKRDELLNVLIVKEGQGSGQGKEPVILQGHQDMVCEKNDDTDFDFSKDPLDIYMDGDLLKARGTTLGGDDGVAVAYMLSILASEDLNHPPLECLFTTQEETGMGGAEVVKPEWLEGCRMINLDCGPENVFVVSSAGGARMELLLKNEQSSVDTGHLVSLRVEGLIGGHSGECIDLERGNALKIMGRLLERLAQKNEVSLVSLEGGDKDNAIPRECTAKFVVSNGEQALFGLQELMEELSSEYQTTDPSLKFDSSTKPIEEPISAFSTSFSKEVIELLFALPDGPARHYVGENNMVASSNNIASIRVENDSVHIITSVRAAVESMLDEIIGRIQVISEKFGAEVNVYSCYPGWAYDPDSSLRKSAEEVYEALFGLKPQVEMVHAGLECGIFKDKIPDLDIIATGPKTIDIHTPEEALDIPSFDREFIFIKGLLEALSEA